MSAANQGNARCLPAMVGIVTESNQRGNMQYSWSLYAGETSLNKSLVQNSGSNWYANSPVHIKNTGRVQSKNHAHSRMISQYEPGFRLGQFLSVLYPVRETNVMKIASKPNRQSWYGSFLMGNESQYPCFWSSKCWGEGSIELKTELMGAKSCQCFIIHS